MSGMVHMNPASCVTLLIPTWDVFLLAARQLCHKGLVAMEIADIQRITLKTAIVMVIMTANKYMRPPPNERFCYSWPKLTVLVIFCKGWSTSTPKLFNQHDMFRVTHILRLKIRDAIIELNCRQICYSFDQFIFTVHSSKAVCVLPGDN